MKHIKKIITAVLCICLMLSFAGCSDTSWVYKVDDVQISSGLYLAELMTAYSQAANQVQSSTGTTISSDKELFKQTIDGKDVKTWIVDKAKTFCTEYAVREKKFSELGLSFTEEEIKTISSTTDSEWEQYGSIYEKNGVSKNTYKLLIEDQVRNEKIFKKYYGEGGLEEVPVDNLKAHFKDDYASINIFAMYQKSGTDLTDADKKYNENIKATADEYAASINSGKKTFNKVKDEYNLLYGTIEAATEDSKLSKDDETKTYVKKDSQYPSKDVVSTIFTDMKADGTAKVIKDGENYYIVVRYDAMKDTKNFEDMRNSVLYNLKTEDFTKKVDEWGTAATVTENKSAVNRYKPTNIDFTSDTAAQ